MTPAKSALVGSFVLGALALGVIAILTFGGTHLFTKSLRMVVVFRNSIAGLEAGAPVTFRGVKIGKVEGMRVHVDVLHHVSWIPVYLDVDLDRISWANGSAARTRTDVQAAVEAGLRAQLVAQSLVSGELSVNLDYHPETPALLAAHSDDTVEIPTIPSDIQDLKDQLRNLDLAGIGLKTQQVLVSLQHVLEEIDGKIGPVAAGLQSTLAATTLTIHTLQTETARTLADVDRLANESRRQIATSGKDLDELLKTAERTTIQADTLVASLNDMSSPRGDLQASLRDLAASASSLRSLTHDLERNPLGTLLRKEK
ncbi:MAG: Mammalian cell entry related domain protein [Gammaproteobacteria bacterium]|nr:Mammalian cell entry related domain protein [Gammaproteobacteria bacterium]